LLEHQWVLAISALPNLIEMMWESYVIKEENVLNFCNQCKEKSICITLEGLGLSSISTLYHQHNTLTDDSFCLVLDTFPNLKAIEICGSNISLATADIPQKLGTLTQLKQLKLNHTNVFSAVNSASIDSVYEWLEISLQYLPKSLEVIEFLNCKGSSEHHMNNSLILDSVRSRIKSKFRNILPHLKEISVTFDISFYNEDDEESDSDDNSDYDSDDDSDYEQR
jgi:hypothetical protein